LANLQTSLEEEQSNNSSLRLELTQLQEILESERAIMAELRVFLEKERREKDAALLRNAQVSQDIEIVRQENRQQEIENIELQNRIENLEDDLVDKVKEAEKTAITLKEFEEKLVILKEAEHNREKLEENERILKSSLLDLEEQLSEKNKVNSKSYQIINIILTPKRAEFIINLLNSFYIKYINYMFLIM